MGWETDDSTGLLGHFIGTVKSSVWTTDSKKQDPNQAFLQWEVQVEDVLQDNFQGVVPETITVNISCGKGWVEDEDGATVEHKDGIEMFKGSSSYGKIIGLVSGKNEDYGSNAEILDGGDDPDYDLSGLMKHMADNGYDDPRQSAIWNGLTFEFRGIGFRYRGMAANETPFQNILPVRLVEGAAPAKATKSTKAAAPKHEPTIALWVEAGADSDLAETLDGLVASSKNHTEFMRNALLLDPVKDDEALRNAVMDAGNYPG